MPDHERIYTVDVKVQVDTRELDKKIKASRAILEKPVAITASNKSYSPGKASGGKGFGPKISPIGIAKGVLEKAWDVSKYALELKRIDEEFHKVTEQFNQNSEYYLIEARKNSLNTISDSKLKDDMISAFRTGTKPDAYFRDMKNLYEGRENYGVTPILQVQAWKENVSDAATLNSLSEPAEKISLITKEIMEAAKYFKDVLKGLAVSTDLTTGEHKPSRDLIIYEVQNDLDEAREKRDRLAEKAKGYHKPYSYNKIKLEKEIKKQDELINKLERYKEIARQLSHDDFFKSLEKEKGKNEQSENKKSRNDQGQHSSIMSKIIYTSTLASACQSADSVNEIEKKIDDINQKAIKQNKAVRENIMSLVSAESDAISSENEKRLESSGAYFSQNLEMHQQNNEELTGLSDTTIQQISDKWIGSAMQVSDVFRNSLGTAVSEVGGGIANELVDGTNDWQQAGKNMLKTLISMTAQMLIMLAISKAIKVALGTSIGGPIGALFGLASHTGTESFPSGAKLRRFHSGGNIRSDEYLAILQGGEGVINRQAMQAPGMREFVSAANKGRVEKSAATNQVINQHYYTIYANDAASFADQMRRNGYQVMEDDVRDGRLFNQIFERS